MKLLQKKGSSLAAMFTAVVIACLGLAQQSEAAEITYPVDIKFMSQDAVPSLEVQVAGTITTDGIVGSLKAINIIRYSLIVTNGSGDYVSGIVGMKPTDSNDRLDGHPLTLTNNCLHF